MKMAANVRPPIERARNLPPATDHPAGGESFHS